MAALDYPTSDSPKITIRHLLSHAAGFPEDNPWGDQQLADTDEQLSQMLRDGIPFSNAPGVAYEYSNFGFAILGRIVANVSSGDCRYTREYVNENILRPLGMTSTTLEPSSVPADRLAHGYRWEDEQWKDEPLLSNGSFGSMGGMLTTLSDLGRYVGAFLVGVAAARRRRRPHRSSGRRCARCSRCGVRRRRTVTRDAGRRACSSRPAATATACASRRTARSRRSSSHSGGLPGFGSIRCAGCPITASASSPSAT